MLTKKTLSFLPATHEITLYGDRQNYLDVLWTWAAQQHIRTMEASSSDFCGKNHAGLASTSPNIQIFSCTFHVTLEYN